MPDTLVAELTASAIIDFPGVGICTVSDVFKQIPSAEAKNAKVAVKRPTGLWSVLPVRTSLRTLKEFVLGTIKKYLPSDWHGDLPAYCRKSKAMKAAAMEVVNDYLYDEHFHTCMDGPDTLRDLAFADGKTLDRETPGAGFAAVGGHHHQVLWHAVPSR